LLLGIDVGFSTNRATTGIARLAADGAVRVGHATTAWSQRRKLVGAEPADVAAIDAPYTRAPPAEPRACERALTLGAFQRRCKPALSHVPGTGRALRAAGRATARQLRRMAPARPLGAAFPRVDGSNVVEAFPNAFLGVCLPDAAWAVRPSLRRGQKFDWLYAAWLRLDLFRPLTHAIGLPQLDGLLDACTRNVHHDERAALVCLLTAAGVKNGRYTAVGDSAGGHLFLPPWPCWAAWARTELDHARARVAGLELWIDGSQYRAAKAIR
jgi:hypothetical protein